MHHLSLDAGRWIPGNSRRIKNQARSRLRKDSWRLSPFLSRLEHPDDSMSDTNPQNAWLRAYKRDECLTGVYTRSERVQKKE